ncbi:glycosyltransferase family protein 64 protein C5-like [Cucurbita maxima]|uniref:Glucosamine inositolphosphorylceramide transferase 1 n=1 Tax=Cucurbita maxima TaxID=3661 RepID=A0A6J1HYX3_CUCMA|nr:glycosyltransferase family protein 64 protein C5-like [Cucurbita maxima]XP_022968184.1 glycosyltransferase family protein 64 protein C5-like [Cucurbita maxima]
MGSTPIGVGGSGTASNFVVDGSTGATSGGGVGGGVNGSGKSCGGGWKWQQRHLRLVSSGFVFFLGCFVLLGSIATLYAWLAFTPQYVRTDGGVSSLGCQEDNEGSWSIGVFYGDSPFSLKPIETANVWRNETAAWPVANPVITCASVSNAGFPSNFVADPFLFAQGDIIYLFYETKNSVSLQGDIGVAKSVDNGATWQPLGVALNEKWHLSFPFVFEHLGKIYMMPESSRKGEVRLYQAVNFPLKWELDRVMLKKPLVDSVIINHNGMYWLLGSDHSGLGTKRNGHLAIWYSSSPLGPWRPHKRNPIYNVDKSFGARNGGRPFFHEGSLYRIGQDCGETYGKKIRVFKVEVLTKDRYKEVEVSLGFEEPVKRRNAWNGIRYHHVDALKLSSGQWIGVMDGDRVPSGDSVHRFLLGCVAFAVVAVLVLLLGLLLGAVNCIVPMNWCIYTSGKRSDAILTWEKSNLFSSKVRRFCSRVNRAPSILRSWVKSNTCTGRLVLAILFVFGVALMCTAVKYIYGGNGAQEAYPFRDHYSQFTLLTMTYDARLWNLKMYVKHYSRCSSVREIVVVWNKGTPPKLSDLDSVVPVRFRIEEKNSLNNRFKLDPLIKTRAVLELDDDIMMTCDDVERGFKVWRQHPDRIVGFYPRLVNGNPLQYRAEKYARTHKGYNMILTGAAFIDSQFAFQMYWSAAAKPGRDMVDKIFNCEDVLLNFLYANASSSQTVEYVRPAWAIDTSKFSGAAISKNTQVHYQLRSDCLNEFSKLYANLAARKWGFDGRKDGWDL